MDLFGDLATTTAHAAAAIGYGPTMLIVLAIAYGPMIIVCRLGARTNYIHSQQPNRLAAPVPPMWPSSNLEAIPVGIDEHGHPVHFPLLGNHLLVAGLTGSGKGSVLWSLVTGAQPARHQGTCEIRAIDPKGGMELGPGADLLDVLVDNAEDGVALLEQAVDDMNDRAQRLADVGIRKLIPGDPDQENALGQPEPLVVLLIDELADLTDAYDQPLKRRATTAIRELLRKGRAIGFCVVAATQDARVEVIGTMRTLFRQRVVLRVADANQVDMILGLGARENGANAHRIPLRHPGTAYVLTEGGRPRRIRFSHHTDEDIQRLSEDAA